MLQLRALSSSYNKIAKIFAFTMTLQTIKYKLRRYFQAKHNMKTFNSYSINSAVTKLKLRPARCFSDQSNEQNVLLYLIHLFSKLRRPEFDLYVFVSSSHMSKHLNMGASR